MKRRTFLQLGGITAATALLEGCQPGNEKLIPFLIPPDEGITPGQPTWYASSCASCRAGCGILARVADGRVKKLEGNPEHPVNRGRLCARGQAAVQELYHPDRITRPLQRSGARGSGEFRSISWSDALGLLTDKLEALQWESSADKLALLTPPLSGSMEMLVNKFMSAFGSPHQISWELLSPDGIRQATRQSFGHPLLPFYNLAESRYLLSFGADFVESHLSPVQYGNAFGRMRQARDTVRGHFTYVGGRMSLTAASADRWLPTRPGSEGALALGMIRVILTEQLFDRSALRANGFKAEQLLKQLTEFDLPQVAGLTGLTQESIGEVAREFATTRPSLAMAGESLAMQTNGSEMIRAVYLLNLVAGNLNQPGGVYPAEGSSGSETSFTNLATLIKQMQGEHIKLAMIKGNPLHTIPPATGFRQALTKVPFIVSIATLLDDTALQADLILPDHTPLESWGDVIPRAGSRQAIYGIMQPVVTPLHDTRQFGDLLLAIASTMGGRMAAALPWQSTLELVQDTARQQISTMKAATFESQWVDLLRRGGQFVAVKPYFSEYRWGTTATVPHPPRPLFAGDQRLFPLHLQVYPTTAFHDGQGAPLPWLQQLPDPMSTVVWDSWIELNPVTAAKLGINQGDLVEVHSVNGSLRLAAVIYPGIRPDVVAIPLGQGQTGAGRYAKNRGVNPLTLLALPAGSEQLPAWHATMVRVSRVSGKGELITAGNSQGSYRSDLIGI